MAVAPPNRARPATNRPSCPAFVPRRSRSPAKTQAGPRPLAGADQSGTAPTRRSSPRRMRRTRPRATTRAVRAGSLEMHRRARLDERGEPRRVPVGQPHAAVRLGVPDVAWLRRAVQAVVLEAECNPDDAHRVV